MTKIIMMAVLTLAMHAVAAHAADRVMVAFDSKGAAHGPPWRVSRYDIKLKVYDPSTLNKDFAQDLEHAKLLVLCRKSGKDNLVLFEKPQYQEAITDFLKRGGTILFQYQASPRWWLSPKAKAYFGRIGLAVYQKPASGWYVAGKNYYGVEPALPQHPLLNTPNSLKKVMHRLAGEHSGLGYYVKPSNQQQVLFQEKGHPDHAAMLIQKKVLGHGTVLMTRLFPLTEKRKSQPLVENIIAYAFGSLGQKSSSATTDSSAAAPQLPKFRASNQRMNPLYLRGLANKAWWHKRWDSRIELVVFEPAGLRRHQAPVRFSHQFPRGTDRNSIRVVTPWGQVLPTEVQPKEDGDQQLSVEFTVDMLPHGYTPLFVYFSDQTSASVDKPEIPDQFQVERKQEHLVVRNSRIQCTFRQDRPALVGLQPDGAATGNQFYTGAGFAPEGYGVNLGEPGTLGIHDWKISVEKTPVRILVRYHPADGSKRPTVIYALRRDANRVDYGIAGDGQSVTRRVGYLPGDGLRGDTTDYLYYWGHKRLQRRAFQSTGTKFDALKMSEGWYAFEDTQTWNIVGEIFDLDRRGKTNVFIHNKWGYEVDNRMHFPAGAVMRGAFVTREGGGARAVRGAYLRFKHPLRVQIGPVQERAAAPSKPHIPVLGKNLLMTYHMEYWAGKGGRLMKHHEIDPEAPQKTIPALIQGLRRIGANYVSMWAYQPFWKSKFAKGPRTNYMAALVKQAHAAGLGVETDTGFLERKRYYGDALPAGWNGDYLQFHDTFVRAAKEVGQTGVDIYLLMDEDAYKIQSDQTRAKFRAEYGMEPAKHVNYKNLAEPAQHDTALFQMKGYTKTLRDMARAVREEDPDMILGDQVNISSLVRLHRGAPHDFDKHSAFLNTLSMDLYGKPTPVYKFYVKYLRGAFNNEHPVLTYSGFTKYSDVLRANQAYLLMWGSDALFSFPPGALYSSYNEAVRRQFYFLGYTGLGDMLARYHPTREVAVFNDRAGLIDSIKRGAWEGQGSRYLKRIEHLVSMHNMQMDILFSKDCTQANLQRYHTVVVTDDPAIRDEHVHALKQFAANGGRVLIEGRTIHNKAVQELVGAAPTGKTQTKHVNILADPPFTFNGRVVPIKVARGSVVCKREGGAPALVKRKVGQGEVLYCPMIASGQVQYQSDVAAWYKELMHGGGVHSPLRVKISNASLDTNLFTDGTNRILAVYNPTLSREALQLAWSGAERPEIVLDFTSGARHDFTTPIRLSVAPGAAQFFYIGQSSAVALPSFKISGAGSGIENSASPDEGMTDRAAPKAVSSESSTGPSARDEAGEISVGVVSDKRREADAPTTKIWGDEAIYQALDDARKIRPALVSDVTVRSLRRFDVLVVPHLGRDKKPSALPSSWEAAIRAYVREGGAALLCYDAIGNDPPVFVTVGQSAGEPIHRQDIKIVSKHPVASAAVLKDDLSELANAPEFADQLERTVMKPGTIFSCSFPNYIPIRAGPKGQVVARGVEDPSAPVIVAGAAGKGKVVLCGTAIGARLGPDHTPREYLSGGEQHVLVNAVHWLAAD